MFLQHLICLVVIAAVPTTYTGYSHNWTWKSSPDSAKLKKCIDEMRLILQASPVPLASVEGKGEPTIRDSILTFNMKGDEEEIGEPFVFPGRTGFNFCKTNGKAYDVVVTACLLVVMDHFSKDECAVGSDGDIAKDWAEGAALYKKVLGRESRSGKSATISDLVKGIDLTPKWGADRLWIVFGLLGLGALAAWYIFNPRPDFTIHLERQGNAYLKGTFPEAYASAVRDFFKKDLPIQRAALVKGWNDTGGRFRLAFVGPISDREQQRIRNFFAMLRKA